MVYYDRLWNKTTFTSCTKAVGRVCYCLVFTDLTISNVYNRGKSSERFGSVGYFCSQNAHPLFISNGWLAPTSDLLSSLPGTTISVIKAIPTSHRSTFCSWFVFKHHAQDTLKSANKFLFSCMTGLSVHQYFRPLEYLIQGFCVSELSTEDMSQKWDIMKKLGYILSDIFAFAPNKWMFCFEPAYIKFIMINQNFIVFYKLVPTIVA